MTVSRYYICSPSAVDGSSDTFLACVVTRAAARCTPAQENDVPTSQSVLLNDQEQDQADDNESVVPNVNNQDGSDQVTVHNVCELSVSHRQPITDQRSDQEVNQQ